MRKRPRRTKKLNDFQNRLISSKKVLLQIIGVMLQWRLKNIALFFGLSALSWCVSWILSPGIWKSFFLLVGLNFVVWMTIKVCSKLTDIFSLRKMDSGVTWCYISILISIGFWLVAFVLIYNTKADNVAAAVALVSGILSIVFKDKIAGVVAFIHLRMHHMLNIGDWIMVPKYNVDGEVKRVSLTSVTIYNWDTTTSVIPINILHSDHFKNLQNMMKGKTYGRRMMMKFILDTSWFHPITEKEVESIASHGAFQYMPKNVLNEEIKKNPINAHIYRLYLYHWLLSHEHISHQPRLIVRWTEQEDGGMPLEIYAFIIDSSLAPYEWQRSSIVEHIIESMGWFGLRLYQSPSAYDVSNSNIYLTDKPSMHRKEDL